jgi:hypothetical protein
MGQLTKAIFSFNQDFLTIFGKTFHPFEKYKLTLRLTVTLLSINPDSLNDLL